MKCWSTLWTFKIDVGLLKYSDPYVTAGHDYISIIFIRALNTSMLKISVDINQQDFKIIDLYFTKSE